MRFLPFEIPDSAWAKRLDELRFRFGKWDLHVGGRPTVPRGALVLSRSEHAEVVRASEALFALADRAQARWIWDDAAAPALGVPDALAPLARAERPAGRVTRIDFFLTADGWRVSEFNDDAPGGFNDAMGLAATLHDFVEKDLEVAGDLPESLPALVSRGSASVGFAYATAYAEDLQVVELLSKLVEADGAATTLASPAHLVVEDGVARFAGERVDAMYRFFPCEWFPLLANLREWERALASGLRVVNPFRCAWTQSKAAFARFHEEATGSDRALARALLPPTRRLDARAPGDRGNLVLKPAFGRMGEGVVLGAISTQAAWEKALSSAALRRRAWVLQERFVPLRVEIAPGVTRTPCIGAYVVDGRFAGYYSRISEHPVVAYDAANVLTLVERV